MIENGIPASWQIKAALDNGANADDIDEMFHPGERARNRERKSKYPIPEGTGRDRCTVRREPEQGRTTDYFVGEIWIGSIYDAWKGCNGGNGYYQTHDGEKFAHWGGSEGAETYLIERYWLYGNPPHNRFPIKHSKYMRFCKKVESGEIKLDMDYYEATITRYYKTNLHWIKLTKELLHEESIEQAFRDYVTGNKEYIEENRSIRNIWMKLRGLV